MEKLEPKHIIAYLNHKLEVIHEGHIKEVHGFMNEEVFLDYNGIGTDMSGKELFEITPLLLPLSSLTEPLEDGSVPIVELAKMKCNWIDESDYERIYIANSSPADGAHLVWFNTASETDELLLCIEEYDVYSQQMSIIDKLIEWHFDIHGLIPAGLAIDKRTVK